jgi:signal peptidase
MIACLAVVIAIASHLSPFGQYTVFGHPIMTVVSGSMAPAIRTGDLAYEDRLVPSSASHLRQGDIITFRVGGGRQTITHRIHEVLSIRGGTAYQTKGDANNAVDTAVVLPGQVVGLYVGRLRFGGYVLNALHQPLTLALLLMSPILWLVSGWLFDQAREAEQTTQPPQP